MEDQTQKKQQTQSLIDTLLEIDEFEIKIGIKKSEDYAKEETARRRIEAPPSQEECILMNV